MPKVVFASSDLLAFTGGLKEIEAKADTVRRLVVELEARFPGLGEFAERRMAFAVDGEIHQDSFETPLAADAEVCLIPKIGGG